ncbi:hypothetical protein [Mesorhizobium sp. YR577]|uniref:hypothetical protein n=1 Tax=Mesorhizobium sp. YR577 TaxID=1884373 RepID=UPI0008E27C93|nr:hypothetical protein [Mesorhizobium sp. YR577]SFU21033.1 hypothetical protein SAMN05518861_12543 [Mesorhizobium sp. YR577]
MRFYVRAAEFLKGTMSISLRYYLFPSDGNPLRLSHRLVEGLISGRDFLPEYAGTRQTAVTAVVATEEGKPTRLVRTEGAIWEFDEDGGIREGLQRALGLAMSSISPSWETDQTVVALRPKLDQKQYDAEFRWEPGQAEIDLMVADIWPKKKTDRLKVTKGVTKRKPPLTYDARHAINEISSLFWKISNAIEQLKEPSQKGFGFEARERSRYDPDYAPLYRAIAEMSEWQLEVQSRRRTGKGIWYAVVEVMNWQDNVGEAAERHYERCQNRNQAVIAARRLLAQHAEKFGDYITVEAELMTDLEWEKRAYPD